MEVSTGENGGGSRRREPVGITENPDSVGLVYAFLHVRGRGFGRRVTPLLIIWRGPILSHQQIFCFIRAEIAYPLVAAPVRPMAKQMAHTANREALPSEVFVADVVVASGEYRGDRI